MEDFEKRQMMKDVGARVYALRTAANMSRETLAERLNITPQYVSEIEQGKKCMNMFIFAELGRVFHRGLDDLAWGEAPADPGLDGLAEALRFRFYANLSHYEIKREGNALLYRVIECRVQQARGAKNMGLHPCKPAGLVEYAGFAKTIDDRITTQCISCYPDITDEGCACAWRFQCQE